ncbi:MAG: hypothetical protein Q4D02_08520 [Clostridia bacterium]|nr:hypothetical protein [Clostridia bacterium]
MKVEEKMKQKGRRNISILTVFLWLALIAVMSVITITGINKPNALEVVRTITIKVDFSGFLQDEEFTEGNKNSIIENFVDYYFWIGKNKNYDPSEIIEFETRYIGVENGIATYEVDIGSEDANYIKFWIDDLLRYSVLSHNELLEVYDNFFVEKLNLDQDIYEFGLSRRDAVRINIDTSESVEEVITAKLMYHDSFPLGGDLVEESEGKLVYEIYPLPNMEYDIAICTKRNEVLEENKVLNMGTAYGYQYYYKSVLVGEEKNDYYFKLKKINPELSSNIIWIDDKNVELGYKLNVYEKFYPPINSSNSNSHYYGMIFVEKLDDNFSISEEYINDSNWLIVNEEEIVNDKLNQIHEGFIKFDLTNNEYIPEYVYANFFEWNQVSYSWKENIQHIYIKDKNILYSFMRFDRNQINQKIKLTYNGTNTENTFHFNTKAITFYNIPISAWFQQYCLGFTLGEKSIGYREEEKSSITINKLIDGEEGNNTYYIGLFENETDEKTDKIYRMDIVDSVGSTTIEMTGYDRSKEYYIYEVDENGNKIVDENLVYNKNKVLENPNVISSGKVSNDKNIVSALLTASSEEPAIGAGEEYYINNMIDVAKTYEDIVTISREKVYVVRYETEEGGKLNGDTEEFVKQGETPISIPKVEPNEDYEFDKWVVIKDGEEIEVNPSEYVITEDITFIAKYKKIENTLPEVTEEKPVDTSDINVWQYVGIAIISVIIIVIIVIILLTNKKKKSKEK